MLNLEQTMQTYFPQPVFDILRQVGETASEMNLQVFLIGGSIRDMLLPHRPFDWDIDFVVEHENAQNLAQAMQNRIGGELKRYDDYGTATLLLEKPLALDFATARTEIYTHPGANPQVKFSSLHEDLARRDFSINALALNVLPEYFGEVIDYFQGLEDLQNRRIVALHPQKFLEDPVRSWRACRFAIALGFELENNTRVWLEKAMQTGHFDGFMTDRIRKELKTILNKPDPLPYLNLLDQLSVLRCVHPQLRLTAICQEKMLWIPRFQREFLGAEQWWVYLMVLISELDLQTQEEVLVRLPWTQKLEKTWGDILAIKSLETVWESWEPAEIYTFFKSRQPEALWTLLSLFAENALARRILEYWHQLRPIKLSITGNIIKAWGAQGPQIGAILATVLRARLNGQIHTPEEELALAKKETEKQL